jgi:predicted transcriptional regulator YheO
MIELLGYFLLAWWIYQIVNALFTLRRIKSAVQEAVDRKTAQTVVDQHVLMVRMEPVQQGDYCVVLAYNHATNRFLGQDATQEQVEAMLKLQYADMNLVVIDENNTVQSIIQPVDANPI